MRRPRAIRMQNRSGSAIYGLKRRLTFESQRTQEGRDFCTSWVSSRSVNPWAYNRSVLHVRLSSYDSAISDSINGFDACSDSTIVMDYAFRRSRAPCHLLCAPELLPHRLTKCRGARQCGRAGIPPRPKCSNSWRTLRLRSSANRPSINPWLSVDRSRPTSNGIHLCRKGGGPKAVGAISIPPSESKLPRKCRYPARPR
jgi:hypothetical protein